MQELKGCRKTRVGVITFLASHFPLADDYVGVLMEEVEKCLAGGEVKIVLDFKNVPYIDSSGLEALLEADESVRKKGGVLKIANPNSICKDIFMATRLAGRFEIFPDIEVAGKSFL